MITEQYVSFETAKMLKEAGFDVPTRGLWRTNRTGETKFVEYDRKQTTDDLSLNSSDGFQYEYLAPTQSLAARWLREVHNIDVVIIPSEDGGYAYDILVRKRHIASSIPLKESYENVLEYGLFMAVKLIKE